MVAAIPKKVNVGAGVYHPSSGNSNSVDQNGAGITNTIGRGELAAIADAHSRSYSFCHRQPYLTPPN